MLKTFPWLKVLAMSSLITKSSQVYFFLQIPSSFMSTYSEAK